MSGLTGCVGMDGVCWNWRGVFGLTVYVGINGACFSLDLIASSRFWKGAREEENGGFSSVLFKVLEGTMDEEIVCVWKYQVHIMKIQHVATYAKP